MVRLDSLPPDVQQRALELWPELAAVPEVNKVTPGRKRRPSAKRGRAEPWPPPRLRAQLDVAPDQLSGIDAELRAKGQSLLNTGISMRRAADYLSMDAYDLCRAAGCALPEAKLRALCRITRHFFDNMHRGRFVAKQRTDAKVWADRRPGILRDWNLVSPLEILIGDVTPLDVRFLRSDGSEHKLRLIAWLDGKTRRLFVHVYAPEKGAGVRMEHIAASYASLVLEIGSPECVYVDGGGEYRCMQLVADAGLSELVKALPYNARAKLIEPIFKALLRFIAEIPGFIGSDRLRKKTQSVGKPAQPFPGSPVELVEAVSDAVRHYNCTRQDSPSSLTPDQAWQAEVDAGWRPKRADGATLIEAFCQKLERTVSRGQVRLNNRQFTAEELWRRADLEGEKVTVAESLFDFPPAVFDQSGAFVCHLYEDHAYHPLDTAGAREAARRKHIRDQGGRALLQEHEPADLQEYRRRALAHHPQVIEPETGDVLELFGERGRSAEARRQHALIVGKSKAATALPMPEEGPEPDYFDLLFEAERKRAGS